MLSLSSISLIFTIQKKNENKLILTYKKLKLHFDPLKSCIVIHILLMILNKHLVLTYECLCLKQMLIQQLIGTFNISLQPILNITFYQAMKHLFVYENEKSKN